VPNDLQLNALPRGSRFPIQRGGMFAGTKLGTPTRKHWKSSLGGAVLVADSIDET